MLCRFVADHTYLFCFTKIGVYIAIVLVMMKMLSFIDMYGNIDKTLNDNISSARRIC